MGMKFSEEDLAEVDFDHWPHRRRVAAGWIERFEPNELALEGATDHPNTALPNNAPTDHDPTLQAPPLKTQRLWRAINTAAAPIEAGWGAHLQGFMRSHFVVAATKLGETRRLRALRARRRTRRLRLEDAM